MAGNQGKGMANYMRILTEKQMAGEVAKVVPKRKPNKATMKFIEEQRAKRDKK